MGDLRSTSGADHLRRLSQVRRRQHAAPALETVLIVAPDAAETASLTAMIRVVAGYSVRVIAVATLGSAVDTLGVERPDLVVLDDRLQRDGVGGVRIFRQIGYRGAVAVVSRSPDRHRRQRLAAAGASAVLDRAGLHPMDLIEIVLARPPLRRTVSPTRIAAE
ncbi:MAG: hypothetical protein R3D33_03535 [Hyphomicrobiaceae bacterium]